MQKTVIHYTGIQSAVLAYVKPCQGRLVGRLAFRKAYLQAGRQTYYSSPPPKKALVFGAQGTSYLLLHQKWALRT